ncbi:hypothetical protein BpHYR1_019058, partial [Brachionus plicatilis]
LKINHDNTFSMLSQAGMDKLFYEEYLDQNMDSTRININFQDCSITNLSIFRFINKCAKFSHFPKICILTGAYEFFPIKKIRTQTSKPGLKLALNIWNIKIFRE